MGKNRRGKGEGTIYQRQDGTWSGQVTVGRDPISGRQQRVTVYGATEKEVQEKILQERHQSSRRSPSRHDELYVANVRRVVAADEAAEPQDTYL